VQGVNCLQDLKKKLVESGFEVIGSHGWYLDTAHGRWTMSMGVVYINNLPIKSISEARIIKKPKPLPKSSTKPKSKLLTKKKKKNL
jgi:hypothetical protein